MEKQTSINRTNKWKSWTKSGLNVGILLVVFAAGIGIGNGKIAWGPDSLLRKTVQKEDLGALDYEGVEELYSSLAQSFDGQLDKTKLQEGLKEGLVEASGDPYTEYLNRDETKQFNEQLNGSFEGIGAELGKENESIIIISPISGFPAEKAGLQPKDVIIEINGESAFNLSITEAVQKIRGPKGTKVDLTIVRGGKRIEVTIIRAEISIPSVKTEYKDDIGIMRISRFGDDTVELATKAATEFSRKKVKGIVLDLRGNPGGRLDSSVKLSSLWLDVGKTVLEEKRADVLIRTYKSEGKGLLVGIPTVVLINSGSASASEITAGALKDNQAATIIGETSFGKGSVQELRDLDYGGVLKVTIARWFTPSGRNIDKEGIAPDKQVKISASNIKKKQDPQESAAIKLLRQQ